MKRLVLVVIAISGIYFVSKFMTRDHGRISSIADYQPLAETTASNPKERVQLYVEDWHNWWSATDSAVGQFPFPKLNFGGLRDRNNEAAKLQLKEYEQKIHSYTDDLKPWLLLEGDVIKRHFVAESATDWKPGGFGSPADHDPQVEKIVQVNRQSDGHAIVETQTMQSSLTVWYEYDVVNLHDDWRIKNVIQFLDPAGVLVCSESKRKKYEREIGQRNKLTPIPADEAALCRQLFTDKKCLPFEGQKALLKVVAVGTVNLQSGIVGVYDFGWAGEDFRPLNRLVSPGSYRVEVVQTEFTSGDVRNAAVRVLLGDPSTVVKWVEASTVDAGNNVVGVDAGNVTIFDGGRFMTLQIRAHNRLYDKYIKMFSVSKRHYKLNLTADSPSTDCVIVDSGFGDGGYPCYWGLDSNGDPAVLLVDFRLVRFSSESPSYDR